MYVILCKHKIMNFPLIYFFTLGILILASCVRAKAQGPPITTESPIMLGLEGSGFRTFTKWILKEDENIYIQPIGLPYNITSKFQIGSILPFKIIKPNGQESKGGFSDLTIFAKYQLYKSDEIAKTFRILANLKQTVPTGKTSSMPQLSTGAYQTYLGLIIGKISTQVGVYGDFGLNITSDDISNNFLYNFAISLPVLPQEYPQKQLNLLLEFNGNHIINDVGIHTLFLSPGLQFIPGRRFLIESSFQFPVLQKNIETNKTKFILLLGIRFLIN